MPALFKILAPIVGGGSQTPGSTYITASVDGGFTSGSLSCADESFSALENIPSIGYNNALTYISSASTGGYSGGSVYCAEVCFESLIEIE